MFLIPALEDGSEAQFVLRDSAADLKDCSRYRAVTRVKTPELSHGRGHRAWFISMD